MTQAGVAEWLAGGNGRGMRKLFVYLLLLGVAFAEEPERVMVITNDNFTALNKALSEGWKVKHQAVAATSASNQYGAVVDRSVFLFTLTAPPAEVLAETRAKEAAVRQAAFDKRRAEFLAKQPRVEK